MVVDSTDRERISLNKEELHKMLESDELCKAAVLVFANKQVMNVLSRVWLDIRFGRISGRIMSILYYIRD